MLSVQTVGWWLDGRQRIKARREPINAERADMGLDHSVLVDERERWLRCDAIFHPYRSVTIDGVREVSDAEGVDELLDCVQVVATCDTHEVDVIAVRSLHLCDRRGFSSTGRSPRSPEPKDGVGPLE